MRLLILGAGYIGAALAARALDNGHEVVLADNWYATDRTQLDALKERGAQLETADIREGVPELLRDADRVFLLAAQASRPVSEREPDYTEETNATGVRRVAENVGVPLVFASSLHVYGAGLSGEVGPETPYGEQGDLAHLSKIYGELCLRMHAARSGWDLSILRLGIVYGPSPVEHGREESQTVVDKFRRLAAEGDDLPVDRADATIGVVHVEDVARIMLEAGPGVANVAAETVTIGDVAALARGEEPRGAAGWTYATPFEDRHSLREYFAR